MIRHFEFAGPARAILVRSALDLAEPVSLQLCAWPWRALDDLAGRDVDVLVDSDDGWRGALSLPARPRLRSEAASPLETAGALIDMLIRLCLEQLAESGHGDWADLHAGSVVIDGKLIALPGASQAGKSTLALQLAANGHVLGGDDRVLVGPLDAAGSGKGPQGLALGMNARVRLPLHADTGRFADFVGRRLIRLEGLPEGIGFLAPLAGEAVEFGKRLPLAGFVLPQRVPGAAPALEKATASDIMRQLLEQTHAPHLPVETLMRSLRSLSAGCPGYVLRYDDSAAAAAAIEALARKGFGELQE